MLSSSATGHDRIGVTVPAALSLKDLGGVIGSLQVSITIAPQSAASSAPAISFSTVRVGSTTLSFTPPTQGNTFTAKFDHTLPAGATSLEFLLSGYTYSGRKQDAATYDVTTLITFQERGTTKQLVPGSTITLVKS
jgi:hypothetical protein